MPEQSGSNSEGNSGEECDFHILFRQHWDAGTGLARHAPHAVKRDGGWIYKTFADAYAKISGDAPDWKTVKSWQAETRRVRERNKNAILATFFPLPRDAAAEGARLAMEEAWQRLPPQSNGTASGTLEERIVWHLDAPQCVMPELVELRLHQPEVGNRGSWYVKATLRVDSQVYRQVSDMQAVLISVHEPTLTLDTPGFPIAENSRIGERGDSHPNLCLRPNGWRVLGTVKAKGEVNLVEGEHLAIIGDDGSGDGPVTAALIGDGRAIRLTPADIEGKPIDAPVLTEEKAAIINLLFRKGLAAYTGGAIVLARHSMRLKPRG
jgi:hypothetical protein